MQSSIYINYKSISSKEAQSFKYKLSLFYKSPQQFACYSTSTRSFWTGVAEEVGAERSQGFRAEVAMIRVGLLVGVAVMLCSSFGGSGAEERSHFLRGVR